MPANPLHVSRGTYRSADANLANPLTQTDCAALPRKLHLTSVVEKLTSITALLCLLQPVTTPPVSHGNLAPTLGEHKAWQASISHNLSPLTGLTVMPVTPSVH